MNLNKILYTLGNDRVFLKVPIVVYVTWYEDEIIASLPEVEVWGAGPTETMAVRSLIDSVLALFEELSDKPDEELGLLPLQWKRVLSEKVGRRVA